MIRLVSSMDLVHCSITVSIQPGDMVAIRRATASRTQRRPIRIDAAQTLCPMNSRRWLAPSVVARCSWTTVRLVEFGHFARTEAMLGHRDLVNRSIDRRSSGGASQRWRWSECSGVCS